MIEFKLTDREQEILAQARAEAAVGRTYARYFDKHEDEYEPPRDVKLASETSPRDVARAHPDDISGYNIVDVLVAIEEAWGDIALRNTHRGIGSMILASGGSQELQDRYFGKVLSIAMTEPGAGSDPSQMQMVVGEDPQTGEWILNGEKVYVSGGGASDGVVVVAKVKDPDGRTTIGTFLVPKGTPGFHVLPQVRKMGNRGWDTVDYLFEDCRIPAESRLFADFKITMTAFNNTRPLVAAKGLGQARAALDFTREALERAGVDLDGEKPPLERNAAAERFLKLEALYDASWLTLMRVKWIEDTDAGSKLGAAMCKAHGGMAVRRITQECIALLGQTSITEADMLEKWFRDARLLDLWEGPGEIQRLIIARELLGYGPRELS